MTFTEYIFNRYVYYNDMIREQTQKISIDNKKIICMFFHLLQTWYGKNVYCFYVLHNRHTRMWDSTDRNISTKNWKHNDFFLTLQTLINIPIYMNFLSVYTSEKLFTIHFIRQICRSINIHIMTTENTRVRYSKEFTKKKHKKKLLNTVISFFFQVSSSTNPIKMDKKACRFPCTFVSSVTDIRLYVCVNVVAPDVHNNNHLWYHYFEMVMALHKKNI